MAGRRRQWRPFEEARDYVRSLGLKSQKQWWEWAKTPKKPGDIPTNPWRAYKGAGWMGFGDWLGTGTLHPKDIEWRPFEDAREFVRSLGLKNWRGWEAYCRSGQKPSDIPAAPWWLYEDQWQGLGDWLGTGTLHPKDIEWRPFEDAREFARALGLKGDREWRAYCKSGEKPADIPTNPSRAYKDQWRGFGDWLGTGTLHPKDKALRPFEEARKFVHTLGIESQREWKAYCKSGEKPADIPTNPWRAYKDQWQGFGDWLGTGYVANKSRHYRRFEEAKAFVRGLGLKGGREWRAYCKSGRKPDDIPASPWRVYKDAGWISSADWLGAGRNRGVGWRPFEEAREFVHSLELKNAREWEAYCRSGQKPSDIPTDPQWVYGKKWRMQ